MELLGKIFGSNARVKIMRLFLFHENTFFTLDELVLRSMVKRPEVRKEINMLSKIGFLKKKKITKKGTRSSKRVDAWSFQKKFDLGDALKQLLIESELIKEKDIITRFKKAGNIKLFILSGIFMKDENRQLDILIVGNRLKREVLNREMKKLESEIGRELNYTFFDTKEFQYRMSMYDKLIRDIMENKKRILIDKITTS